jgi:transposase-like protein
MHINEMLTNEEKKEIERLVLSNAANIRKEARAMGASDQELSDYSSGELRSWMTKKRKTTDAKPAAKRLKPSSTKQPKPDSKPAKAVSDVIQTVTQSPKKISKHVN